MAAVRPALLVCGVILAVVVVGYVADGQACVASVVLLALVLIAALAGCGARALWLKSRRPDVYQHLEELAV